MKPIRNKSRSTGAIPLLVCLTIGVVAGCRGISDDGIGSDTDTETGEYPDPAPGGGCPDGSFGQFDNSDSPYRGGDKDVLVEANIATDFHCPYCMEFAMLLLDSYTNPDYQNYVRLYHHHFPLDMHPRSKEIHMASVAVANQSEDKFWTLHDEIFNLASENHEMTIKEVEAYAETVLKLDMKQFQSDRISKETLAIIEHDHEQAIEHGLTGTPTLWVCGIKVRWADFNDVVDHFLRDAVH